VCAVFHPVVGVRPLLLTETRTRPPEPHTDVTLWYVLTGSQSMRLESDGSEFRGLRWVGIDQPADWIDTCYAPPQVSRFLTKLVRTLNTPAAS
jgi:8-oxo-dGTP diphosphatase